MARGGLRIGVSASTRKAERELKSLRREFAKSRQAAGGLSKSMTVMGTSLGAVTGALRSPAVLVGTLAAGFGKLTVEADKARSTLARATGARGEELAAQWQNVKDVLKGVPDSIGAIAAAYGQARTILADASDEAVAAVVKQSADFARIAGADVAAVADQMTRATRIWDLSAAEVAGSIDVMTGAAQRWGIAGDKLSRSLQMYGPLLKTMGLGLDEATVFLSQFSAAGVDSEKVGAAFQQAASKVVQAGGDIKQTFDEMITTVIAANSEQEALQAATDLFGTRYAGYLVPALRSGKITWEDLAGQIEQTRVNTAEVADETATFGERAAEVWNKVKAGVDDTTAAIGAAARATRDFFAGHSTAAVVAGHTEARRSQAGRVPVESAGIAGAVPVGRQDDLIARYNALLATGVDGAEALRQATEEMAAVVSGLFSPESARFQPRGYSVLTTGRAAHPDLIARREAAATPAMWESAGGWGNVRAGDLLDYSPGQAGQAGSGGHLGSLAGAFGAAAASSEEVMRNTQVWADLVEEYGQETVESAQGLGLSLDDLWQRFQTDQEAALQREIEALFAAGEATEGIRDTMQDAGDRMAMDVTTTSDMLQTALRVFSQGQIDAALQAGATLEHVFTQAGAHLQQEFQRGINDILWPQDTPGSGGMTPTDALPGNWDDLTDAQKADVLSSGSGALHVDTSWVAGARRAGWASPEEIARGGDRQAARTQREIKALLERIAGLEERIAAGVQDTAASARDTARAVTQPDNCPPPEEWRIMDGRPVDRAAFRAGARALA